MPDARDLAPRTSGSEPLASRSWHAVRGTPARRLTDAVTNANLIWEGYGMAFLEFAASIYPGYDVEGDIGQVIVGTLYGLLDGAIAGVPGRRSWTSRALESIREAAQGKAPEGVRASCCGRIAARGRSVPVTRPPNVR